MHHKNHAPSQHRAKHRQGNHHREGFTWVYAVHNCRHRNATGRQHQGIHRHTIVFDFAQERRRITGTRQAEHHACGNVEHGIHRRQSRNDDNHIQNTVGIRHTQFTHHRNERAGRTIGSQHIPRHQHHNQSQRQQVENHQAVNRGAKGFFN